MANLYLKSATLTGHAAAAVRQWSVCHHPVEVVVAPVSTAASVSVAPCQDRLHPLAVDAARHHAPTGQTERHVIKLERKTIMLL